ncbi:hypothetical protein FPV67DRAFT_1452345 [Lyophyllum atratum]|nr:hypothetical protein FPV67DRAFT_1452345 [Lyophyllum atratum]
MAQSRRTSLCGLFPFGTKPLMSSASAASGSCDCLRKEQHQKKSSDRRALAEEVTFLLSAWGLSKPAGLSDGEPIHELWRYLGPHWLTGSQQNDMLSMLRDSILARPRLDHSVRVEGVQFTQKLLNMFSPSKTAEKDTYHTNNNVRWIRELGDAITCKHATLITTANLEPVTDGKNEHWVVIVVEGRTSVLHYGDGFRKDIPDKLREAYQWWMKQHGTALSVKELPISQQTDGFSCRILADNAEGHFVPEEFLLVQASELVVARLKIDVNGKRDRERDDSWDEDSRHGLESWYERYPETQQKIKDRLTDLREAGVALTLITIRAIMIAFIEDDAPHLFTTPRNDGSCFRCSDSFVRKYLHRIM